MHTTSRITSVFSYDENVLADKFYEDIEDPIESRSDYLSRKREVDMSVLLENVIENDLSDTQRRVLRKMVVEGVKPQVIAEELSVNLSTVYKIYNNAIEKIRTLLKYAVMYQQDCLGKELLPLDVKKSLCRIARKEYSGSSVAHRLRALMGCENISAQMVSEACGIEQTRLEAILTFKQKIGAEEAVVLSGFFNITTDYLLKGDKNE